MADAHLKERVTHVLVLLDTQDLDVKTGIIVAQTQ
jgi:hypothetical protein